MGNQNQPHGLGSTFGGSGLNTQPTGLGALNSQQPLTTGLGGGFGTGFSTTNGLGPQMTDAQGAVNPFRMTMFSNNASTPAFGGGGGGLGTNPVVVEVAYLGSAQTACQATLQTLR